MSDIKRELQSIKDIDNLIKSLKRQKEDMYDTLKSSIPSGNRVQSSNISTLNDTMVKLERMDIKINGRIAELTDKKERLLELIDKLDERYRVILYMRYFEFMKWEEVAYRLTYDYRWVTRLHGMALQKLNEVLRDVN